MLTLKIVSHTGNEILKEIADPEFKRNENTIYFTDQKGESDKLTLNEGETSDSHDTAYVMNECGATVSTWHYKKNGSSKSESAYFSFPSFPSIDQIQKQY